MIMNEMILLLKFPLRSFSYFNLLKEGPCDVKYFRHISVVLVDNRFII